MHKSHHVLTGILLSAGILLVMNACEDETPTHYVDNNWSEADIVQGGLLYDKWWKVNNITEPTTDFAPIWSSQTTNTRSGSDTWRCKECHGWDYIGLEGRYSSGSHYTGFSGVMDISSGDKADIFDAIKDQGGDHDLSAVLSDTDILNLTKFIADGLVDMSLYLDANSQATGDTTLGKTLYNENCASCHGSNGFSIDFDSDDGSQGIGWLANDNPQEVFHKIRWGHPGSDPEMPSMVGEGLTDDQTGDILAFCQALPISFEDIPGGNMVRGGLLYDKWWKVNNATEPTTEFDPIWSNQTTNTRSGSDTWRCKECHGWDYIGLEGRYSSGSHYTGFSGVMDISSSNPSDIFDAIKDQGGDHDLSSVLTDEDIVDLTLFIQNGLVDMYQYLDANYTATGDAVAGESLYNSYCSSCHGADGKSIDFDSDDGSQGIGWLTNDNPQEVFHKIRWGHPGSNPTMPSMIGLGLTDDDTGDLLTYCQSLPQ